MIEMGRHLAFRALLTGLEAAGEETRLRILCLLEAAELTVSELVAILGQSQPRVSRHLRLLVEAGLATRQREGAWAFFRLAEPGGALAREWLRRLDPADPTVNADRVRLDFAREARRKQAAAYFADARRRLGSDPRAACAGGAGRGCARRHDRNEAVPQPSRSRHRHGPHARGSRPPRGSRGRRRPERGDAGAGARPHRSGWAPTRLASPGRHLRAACRARRLRSRRHPPGSALPRRSGSRAR